MARKNSRVLDSSIGAYVLDFPIGAIDIWSGSEGDIPEGWQLCDGTNGTPDLRDRFVVGAGDSYSIDDTGGSDTHSHGDTFSVSNHTLNTSRMPSHSHTQRVRDGSANASTVTPTDYNTADSIKNANSTANSGSGGSHGHGLNGGVSSADGRPPYYALAYIQRVA